MGEQGTESKYQRMNIIKMMKKIRKREGRLSVMETSYERRKKSKINITEE
jgi:hypothetical protein